MRIAVVDGQGGGIGKALIEKLRASLGPKADIIALGTNSLATSLMLKSGASEGATGENAIVANAPKADVITGSIGIISANSMLGELSPAMSEAISASPAQKVLIPMNRCNICIVGLKGDSLPNLIDSAVEAIIKITGCC